MKIRRPAATCGLIAALAAATAASTPGCSYMLSKPPPRTPIATFYDCSDSTLPVWLDGYLILNAGAVALAGFGGAAIVHDEAKDAVAPSWNPHPDQSGVPTLLIVGTLATGATIGLIYSAIYGARSADACVAARADFLSRPPFYPPPPPDPPPPGYPPPSGYPER